MLGSEEDLSGGLAGEEGTFLDSDKELSEECEEFKLSSADGKVLSG